MRWTTIIRPGICCMLDVVDISQSVISCAWLHSLCRLYSVTRDAPTKPLSRCLPSLGPQTNVLQGKEIWPGIWAGIWGTNWSEQGRGREERYCLIRALELLKRSGVELRGHIIGSLCCVASIIHSFAGVFATSYGEEERRCELAWFVSKQLYSSDVRANVCRLLLYAR